jgi:8-oxo-dGTP pyrophosphatase MutT (NUDIX family)
MLVTSRETRRWIIPKGWPHKGKAPHHSAAREAFEEAGVVGAVASRPAGSFAYRKRLKSGRVVVCEVHVFPLRVSHQTKLWPERRQREVKWVSAKEAADTVREPSLARSYVAWLVHLPGDAIAKRPLPIRYRRHRAAVRIASFPLARNVAVT